MNFFNIFDIMPQYSLFPLCLYILILYIYKYFAEKESISLKQNSTEVSFMAYIFGTLPRPGFCLTRSFMIQRLQLTCQLLRGLLTTSPKEASWALLRHTILLFFHQSIYKCLMFPCSCMFVALSVTLDLVDISFFNVHS